MSASPSSSASEPASGLTSGRAFGWKPIVFLLVAIVGLYYIKWSPYYLKSFAAAANHSIGASILNDTPDNALLAALSYSKVYFLAIWKAALLGVVLGSLIQVLIPQDWLLRVFGKAGLGSTVRGSLFALPGMMCTCCAAPVVAGMRRQNVSVGAALAFWIANPVLNPATLVFMGFVLGWDFAAVRLIAGVLMVLAIALIAQRMASKEDASASAPVIDMPAAQGSIFMRWLGKLWQLFWSTIPVYVLAVLALGAARVWLFPHGGEAIGNSAYWLVVLAIAGTLFMIPTAAEIPVVQTMMSLGLGVGPAVALLMTLPSISLPSLFMLRKSFSTRILCVVTALTIAIGIITGLVATVIL